MKKKLFILMCMVSVLVCNVFVFEMNVASASENTVSNENVISGEDIMVEKDSTIDYPQELESYVQNIVDKTDPDLISADPQLNGLKESLYEMKQVYPDKSYEELDQMLETVETEADYQRLLGRDMTQLAYST